MNVSSLKPFVHQLFSNCTSVKVPLKRFEMRAKETYLNEVLAKCIEQVKLRTFCPCSVNLFSCAFEKHRKPEGNNIFENIVDELIIHLRIISD